MQILFKTRYEDDIRFLAKTGEKVRVGLVLAFLLAAPLFLQTYYLAELGMLLVYAKRWSTKRRRSSDPARRIPNARPEGPFWQCGIQSYRPEVSASTSSG